MKSVISSTLVLVLIGVGLVQCNSVNASNPELKIGSQAPAFTLDDQGGKPVSLSDFAGKVVVLEWTNPDCPFVKRHYREKTMSNLADKYAGKEVVWLAMNSTHYMSQKDNASWVAKQNLPFKILDDSNGVVGKSFGARTTPHMFVIDPTGKLAYNGAIDDDNRGSKSAGERNNYVDAALGELVGANAVSVSQTEPYGCSVKYKS